VSDLDDGGNNDCVFTIAIVFTISSLRRRERLLSQNQNGLKLWHGNVGVNTFNGVQVTVS
jgi:hypothetical protein